MLKNKKVVAGLKSSIFWLVFSFFIICIYLYSANYSAIKGFPKLENGIEDVSGYDFSKDGVWVDSIGDAKFYYGKWIVTDNENEENCSYVPVPGSWIDEGYPSKGYATYIYQYENFKVGDKVAVFQQETTACRIFIKDGDDPIHLYTTTGEMSKTEFHKDEQKKIPFTSEIHIMNSTTLKVYIEYGFTPYGGEYSSLLIQTLIPGSLTTNYIVIVSAGIAVVICCILLSGISFVPLWKGKRKIPFFTLGIFLLVDYLFTDFPLLAQTQNVRVFSVFTSDFLHIICLLMAFIVIIVMAVNLGMLSKPKGHKWPYFASLCLITSSVIFGFTYNYWYAIFSTLPILAFSVYLVYKASLTRVGLRETKYKISIPVFILFFIYLLYYMFSMAWVSHMNAFSIVTFHSLFSIVFALLASFTNLLFAQRCNVEIQEAEINRHLLKETKTESLIKQIQPHFLFNSLNTVSAQYHSSMEDGDQATLLLSNNLRAAIDAGNKALIPFTTELDNITNYSDFTNLSCENKVDVLYDISYESFSTPPLSIQVFVENCFKHGKLSSKKDGLIIISTAKENNEIIIKIKDNGVGYDTSKPISKEHSGISNATLRLKTALNASVKINSKVGEGTEVIVSIPLADNGVR